MEQEGAAAATALAAVDDAAREVFVGHRQSAAIKTLSWLSEVGDQPQMRTISGGMIAAGFLLRDRRMARAGVRMLLAHELATLAKNFVKHRVDRTRPRSAGERQEQQVRPGRSTAKEETSFPSGHSAGVSAVARAFASEYPEHKGPAYAAAGMVALAQVPRCAHYPTDVGAGILIGVAAEAAVGLVLEKAAGMSRSRRGYRVERLHWQDEELGSIALPSRPLELRASFGSGLARRASDPPDIVWAIGDRGPNLKIKTLVERYGLDRMRDLEAAAGTKVMPRLDLGPRIAKLRVGRHHVELVDSFRLTDRRGEAVSGLPMPNSSHALAEPAIDLGGAPLRPDPSGLDTEGIAALADGGFWAGDEFGPSLVRLDAEGRVLERIVPETLTLEGAQYPVTPALPAIAAKRQLNRGFEAIALSADERWLFLAFQSPLAHPSQAAHEQGRHVRIWRLDPPSMKVVDQYLYPLDEPQSFVRDAAKGSVDWSDLKVSELVACGDKALLVLERASETTKIYRVELEPECALPPEQLDLGERPTVEELSAQGRIGWRVLGKSLLFSSDEAPEMSADLEGMAMMSPSELLLVNDNDFGVEGAYTTFWRLTFDDPILR